MNLKFTQFNFVNSEDLKGVEKEEWSTKMEESDTLFSLGEQEAEYSPSDETINSILDFARSHKTVPSMNLKFIDIYMN